MSRQYSASSSGGSPPPATNVRVMSAQQREALSLGQMSTSTGSPATISPKPDSCPRRDCAPWETITSSGSSQPCSSHDGLHRGAHLLAGQAGAQLADQRARDAHRRVGGLLRAPDAFELGLVLDAAAAHELVVVDGQLDAVRAQVVGDEERELGRDGRLADARAPHARRRDLGLDRVPRSTPAAISSSLAERVGSITSMPCAETLSASSTETVAARRPSFSR